MSTLRTSARSTPSPEEVREFDSQFLLAAAIKPYNTHRASSNPSQPKPTEAVEVLLVGVTTIFFSTIILIMWLLLR